MHARHAPIAGLAAILLSTSAHAGFTNLGGGDTNVVPLYRGFNFAAIDTDGSGGFSLAELEGIDYASNVAPTPVVNQAVHMTAGSSTMDAYGQTTYSGFYAGRNYASLSVTNANSAYTYYQVAGYGTATSVRFFTPEAAAGSARFTWHVSGTESAHAPGVLGRNTGRLDFGASIGTAATWNNLFNDPGDLLDSFTEFGPGTYTYDLPIADLGATINLFYWSSAFVQVDPGEAPSGSNFTLTADYANTIVLENVALFDEDGNELTDWELYEETSGLTVFDAGGRFDDITDPPGLPGAADLVDITVPVPTTDVPAPPALGLFGAALVLLRVFRRRTQ